MLISVGDLSSIRRVVGPKSDEGYFRIKRKGTVAVGANGDPVRAAEAEVEVVAGRQSHVGDLTPEQKQKLGIIRQDVKYYFNLEAFCDCRIGDVLEEIALDWQAEKYYFKGQKVVPSTENGKLYRASTAGRTGVTEPTWETLMNETNSDGTAVWTCQGSSPRYDVLEIAGPSTFGDYIAKRVYGTLQQAGKKV